MTNVPQVFSKAGLINHLCKKKNTSQRTLTYLAELLIISVKHMVPFIAFRCNYGADYFSLGITPITDGTSTYFERHEAKSTLYHHK